MNKIIKFRKSWLREPLYDGLVKKGAMEEFFLVIYDLSRPVISLQLATDVASATFLRGLYSFFWFFLSHHTKKRKKKRKYKLLPPVLLIKRLFNYMPKEVFFFFFFKFSQWKYHTIYLQNMKCMEGSYNL